MGSGCRLLSGRGGFTLLELLLVVTVLSAVAWMSLGVVSNNSDQVRFEDTRNRLQAIRRAIIGDTSRTVNGGPEVRGYVADMGRLPENLQALVYRQYCKNHPDITTNASDECTDAGGTWVSQPTYVQDLTTGIWSGWNGPYLPLGFGSSGRYLDGWGRNDDSNNFGWIYNADSPGTGDLTIRSRGRDGVAGGEEPYDSDYPLAGAGPLVNAVEYLRELHSIYVFFDLSDYPQCYRCVSHHGNQTDCEVGDGTWNAVRKFTGSCSSSLYTSKSECVSYGHLWNITESIRYYCSYRNETDCVNHYGNWKEIETYLCSDNRFTVQSECVANGYSWDVFHSYECFYNNESRCLADGGSWIEDKDTVSAGCKSSSSKWHPEEQICLSIIYKTNGALAPSLYSSGPIALKLNGAITSLPFDFGTDKLSLGQAAYAITKGSTCPTTVAGVTPTNSFPTGAPLWTPFTYVPGTTLSFERKITQ